MIDNESSSFVASTEEPVDIKLNRGNIVEYLKSPAIFAGNFDKRMELLTLLRIPKLSVNPTVYFEGQDDTIDLFYQNTNGDIVNVASEIALLGASGSESMSEAFMMMVSSLIPTTTGIVTTRGRKELGVDYSELTEGDQTFRNLLNATLNYDSQNFYFRIEGTKLPLFKDGKIIVSSKPTLWSLRYGDEGNLLASSLVGSQFAKALSEEGIESGHIFGRTRGVENPIIWELAMIDAILEHAKVLQGNSEEVPEVVRVPSNIMLGKMKITSDSHPHLSLERRERVNRFQKVIKRWQRREIVEYKGDASEEYAYELNEIYVKHAKLLIDNLDEIKSGKAVIRKVDPELHPGNYFVLKVLESISKAQSVLPSNEVIAKQANLLASVNEKYSLNRAVEAEHVKDLLKNLRRKDIGIDAQTRKFNKRIIVASLGDNLASTYIYNQDGSLSFWSNIYIEYHKIQEEQGYITRNQIYEIIKKHYPQSETHSRGSDKSVDEYIDQWSLGELFQNVGYIQSDSGYVDITREQIKKLDMARSLWVKTLRDYEFLTSTEEGKTFLFETFRSYEMDKLRKSLSEFMVKKIVANREQEVEESEED